METLNSKEYSREENMKTILLHTQLSNLRLNIWFLFKSVDHKDNDKITSTKSLKGWLKNPPLTWRISVPVFETVWFCVTNV